MTHPPFAERNSDPARRLEIILEPPRVGEEFVRHGCLLRRIDGTDHLDTPLWYELPARLPQISPDDAEPFLIASIMDAMEEDRDLHVGGRVSFLLLSNLQEFMAAWSRWLPETFHVVDVTADSISTSPHPTDLPHDTAVVLHTGGLNATSTIYRHANGLEGHRSRRITAGVMVQGFLISLDDGEKFARSIELARSALDSIGIATHPLRTNYREAIRTHWSNAYGIAFVSVLQFFKPLARWALIGAPKSYEDIDAFPNGAHPLTPYGSNPFTNALLSSDSMQIIHDGSRFDLMEKTAIVARWPEGTRNLRVCWRRGQIEDHCGACEDCIRTKLGFLVLGETYPTSLGAVPTAWEILNLGSISYDGRVEFAEVLDHCRRHGIKDPWVHALRFRVRFDRICVKLLHWKWLVLNRIGKASCSRPSTHS